MITYVFFKLNHHHLIPLLGASGWLVCFENVYDMLFICYETKFNVSSLEKSNTGCSDTIYGCCPDQVTIATGPNNEGCSCKFYFQFIHFGLYKKFN